MQTYIDLACSLRELTAEQTKTFCKWRRKWRSLPPACLRTYSGSEFHSDCWTCTTRQNQTSFVVCHGHTHWLHIIEHIVAVFLIC